MRLLYRTLAQVTCAETLSFLAERLDILSLYDPEVSAIRKELAASRNGGQQQQQQPQQGYQQQQSYNNNY